MDSLDLGLDFRQALTRCHGRQAAFAALLSLACASLAPDATRAEAPSPDPVTTHFQAFTEALERRDLALAEREAAAALEVSTARDGDGGHTAVLALHLATVRLAMGNTESAIEPASTAMRLATAHGTASGVDPAVAELVLGRAELRSHDTDALERLERAVAREANQPGMAPHVYPAAVELGQVSFALDRFQSSRAAWAIAGRMLRKESQPNSLGLAATQLGEAKAGAMVLVQRDRLLDTPIARKLRDDRPYREIDQLLVNVIDSVGPQARQPGQGADMTYPQRLFAEALAWRAVIKAKLWSEDRHLKLARDTQTVATDIVTLGDGPPPCASRLDSSPRPVFPRALQMVDGVGAVVLKMRFDDSGRTESAEVAASVGGPGFVESVSAVMHRWRLDRAESATTDCRLARETFLTVIYTL
jgi:hypothetical protein